MHLLEAALRVHESDTPDQALLVLVEALSGRARVRAAWIDAEGRPIAAVPDGYAPPAALALRAVRAPAAERRSGGSAEARGDALLLPLPPGGDEALLLEVDGGWTEEEPEGWDRLVAAFARVVKRTRAVEEARTEQLSLRQRAEESEALHTLGLAANRTLDPDEVVSLVARFTRTLLGAHYVTVSTVEGSSTRTVASVGLRGDEQTPDDPLAALVVRERRPVPVGTEDAELQAAELPFHAAEGMRVGLGVPLSLFGDTFGALVVGYRRPYTLTPRDTRLALTLAGHAAVAINNARLHATLAARSDELERAYEELRWSSQAKERYFATMSHELRTPLNAILGYHSLILDGVVGEVSPAVRSFLEKATRAADSLLHLVNDVLDLSKIEAGKMDLLVRAVAPRELVEDALGTIAPLAEQKGLRIVFPPSPALPEIHTDSDRVRQILVNLLSNAVKFTDMGQIAVTVDAKFYSVEDPDGRSSVLHPPGRTTPLWLEIRVADTGPGVTPENRERIFHEFEQIAGIGSRGGTGLGLPISRKLARLLGGDLTMESSPGAGAAFTLRLPLDARIATGMAVAQVNG